MSVNGPSRSAFDFAIAFAAQNGHLLCHCEQTEPIASPRVLPNYSPLEERKEIPKERDTIIGEDKVNIEREEGT
jgi:hypothetical protein